MFRWLIAVSFIYFTLLPVSMAANSVKAIRIAESADKTRVVFDLARKPLVNMYATHKKTRLVVDFAATSNSANMRDLAGLSSNITQVEQVNAAKASDLRVILHFAQPLAYRTFQLPADKQNSYRLVIDLPGEPLKNIDKSKVNTTKVTTKAIPKSVVKTPPRDIVIAIDAGHGGKDPGSIGFKKFVEKDINLAIAKRTVAILNQKQGIKAVLIRRDDRYISLDERSAIARKYKAELLVSVHSDGFTSSQPSGASTLILSKGRANYEFKQNLKNEDKLDGLLGGVGEAIKQTDADDSLQRMFLDLGQQYSRGAGLDVASLIHHELARVTKMHKDKPYEQSLAVLKSVDIPSVLVEAGFVTNYREGQKLTSKAHQQKIANAIAQGTYQYFRADPPKDTYLAQRLERSHTVAKGESLSVIANRYGTTVTRLKQLNKLTQSTVYIGQNLKIPTS